MSASAAAPTAASLYNDRAGARMPMSAVGSIVLHAAVLGLWLYTLKHVAVHHEVSVGSVDIIKVTKAVPLPEKQVAKAPPAVNTFDFLKMALPSAPRLAAPKMAEVKLPETHKPMTVEQPKLHDRGRLDTGPKLDMDVEHHDSGLDIAKVESRIPQRKLAAMAAMPKLEDIGRRRVANLPAALAMEEKRNAAAAGLQGVSALSAKTERRGVAAAEAIQDAAPAAGSQSGTFGSKIASLLPERSLDMSRAQVPAQVRESIAAPAEAPKRKRAALQTGAPKKGVEIEGPLADRKVLNYEIPEFPAWAKEQGILEASVAIRFWVSKDGEVLPNMRVEHTSGYGRLDKLAMDALSKWKFAPLLSEERQWGVITFRFLLE
jgi:TonB family protein